jgi:hypothetical protein
MDRMLVDLPLEVRTPRLTVRCYRAGDGPSLHAAATRNSTHLARFEAGNILLTARNEDQGEIIAREMHAQWVSREAFFAGAFLLGTGDFVGQVYLGPVDWDLPGFEVGYMADRRWLMGVPPRDFRDQDSTAAQRARRRSRPPPEVRHQFVDWGRQPLACDDGTWLGGHWSWCSSWSGSVLASCGRSSEP